MDLEIKTKLNLRLYRPFGGEYSIVLKEYFDVDKLKQILHNREYVKKQIRKSVLERNPFQMAEKLLRNAPKGELLVRYNFYEALTFPLHMLYPLFRFYVHPLGRLQSKKHVSLQKLPREFRHTLTQNIYDDIDQVNAHPIVLRALCEKFDIPHPYLAKYVNERDSILENVSKLNNISREDAKKFFIHMMDGDREEYKSLKHKTKFMENFFAEMQQIVKKIINIFPRTLKQIKIRKQLREELVTRVEESVLKLLLYTIENHILMAICYFYRQQGLLKKNAVLLYDGLLIPKNPKNKKVLKQCEKFVFDIFKIPIKLKIKPMKDGINFDKL